MQVRIVGLGVMQDEKCYFCGADGQIYVSKLECPGMIPACNKCVGSGSLGGLAKLLWPNMDKTQQAKALRLLEKAWVTVDYWDHDGELSSKIKSFLNSQKPYGQ